MSQTGCNDECSHNPETAETRSSTPEMPAVSAFFSLAALAEVAAMENVHRLGVCPTTTLGGLLSLTPLCTTGIERATWKLNHTF